MESKYISCQAVYTLIVTFIVESEKFLNGIGQIAGLKEGLFIEGACQIMRVLGVTIWTFFSLKTVIDYGSFSCVFALWMASTVDLSRKQILPYCKRQQHVEFPTGHPSWDCNPGITGYRDPTAFWNPAAPE